MTVRTVEPTKVPGIPKPPASVDAETRRYLEALAEAVEIRLGRRGDPIDRAITLRELVAGGLAANLDGANFNERYFNSSNIDMGPIDISLVTDLTPPSVITNLTVTGAYSVINMSWTAPIDGNFSQTEVWSHTSDSIGDATLTGITPTFTFSDPVGGDATRYYWVRAVSTSNIYGPFNSAAGTVGTTATDVAHQLEVLGNAITSSQLASSLATPIALIPGIQTTANAAATSAQLSTEATTRATADSALSSTVSTLSSTVGDNTSAIQTEATTRATADSALSSTVSTLSSTVGDNTSAIQTEATTRATADSALSSTVSTLSSTVGGHTTSIQTNATSVNGLSGQYSVKIDSNGHVAGFGLSNTLTTAGPTSAFIVRADKFAVIDPASVADGLGTTSPTTANIPFFIQGGTTYIKAAAILDASITDAKIGTLGADKITSGFISSDRIDSGSINVNKLELVGTGATINLKSANTGARMVIQGSNIQVFDSTGALRVKLGAL